MCPKKERAVAGLLNGLLPGARRYKSTDTGGQNTTQTSTPWGPQGTALKQSYAKSAEAFAAPQEFYPGQTYAGFTPQQEAGLAAQTTRATEGSPLLGQAQGYTGDVLSGQYLDAGNPYLAGVADNLRNQIQPAVASQFAGAGRFGGGGANTAQQERFTKDFTRAMAPYAFGNYESERGRQDLAAASAPGLAREDYFDPAQLFGAGQTQQQQNQLGISEDVSRFDFGQQADERAAQQYAATIQGLPTFGTTTGSSQSTANTGLLGAGTAMNLIGMGK